MATHSSTLAWKIPRTEEPGRLWSMGSGRVGLDWVTSLSLFTFMHWRRKWQPTSVILPGESQGQWSLVGCRLWGHTELGQDWSDLTVTAISLKGLRPWHHENFSCWKRSYFVFISMKLYRCVCLLSHVWFFATPWTVAHQIPPSTGFSREEYLSGLPFPPPGDLDSRIEPMSLASLALTGRIFTTSTTRKFPNL